MLFSWLYNGGESNKGTHECIPLFKSSLIKSTRNRVLLNFIKRAGLPGFYCMIHYLQEDNVYYILRLVPFKQIS